MSLLGRVRARLARAGAGAPDPTPASPQAALLAGSPLFDLEWYADQAATTFGSRLSAAQHYLDHGVAAGAQPGPLVDPAWLRLQWTPARVERLAGRDPLELYLRRELWETTPHPVIDLDHYLAQAPEAAQHPGGPLTHWLTVGRARGLRLNAWLDGDAVEWLRATRDEVRLGGEPQPFDPLRVQDALPWEAMASQEQTPHLVSVVMPTFRDLAMTWRAVESVVAAGAPVGWGVEVLVWDNGSSSVTAAGLAALEQRFAHVTVLRSAANLNYALGNNCALPQAAGEVVVFLNNDTVVPAGWLDPLVGRLGDPDVLGVQPLLLYPTGAIQCGGVLLPSAGGIPYPYLQGFAVDPGVDLAALRFQALTGAALAMRWDDVVALRGFDPIFINGMEDLDLCLRAAARRPGGRFGVEPSRPVVHYESRTPGRFRKVLPNRRLFAERWNIDEMADPALERDAWAAAGLELVGHDPRPLKATDDLRLLVSEPVLHRPGSGPATVTPRPLRWAIKNAAVSGPRGDVWGDTHFAAALAGQLRALGHRVVIDRRGEFERETRRYDDVELLLRGRLPLPVAPQPGPVSLAWVISHPELVTPEELASYDTVLAASVPWAARASAAWGIDVQPLLQATDPTRFAWAEPDVVSERALFVGSTTGRVRPIVHDAVEAGLALDVYGGGWAGLLPDGVLGGDYLANEELPEAYRTARLVLNDHWDDMRAEGFISNRVFDAVACGARVVSDDVDGLADLFGASVQTYATATHLRRFAPPADLEALFGTRAARRAVAERIATQHSFAARARTLTEIAARTLSRA